MKKLVFKISNLLEDNGFLDVENGEIASPEKIRKNAQRRYEDDQLSRDDRHAASLVFTNIYPIHNLGHSERWHLFITIINFLKQTPVQYIDLENADIIDTLKTNTRLKKSKSKIIRENQLLLENLISMEEFLLLFNEVLSLNPPKIHKPVKHRSKKKSFKRTIVMHLSDTHFQAQIDEEEMGGLNKYTSTEEARRLAFFVREVANYKLHYRDNTDLVIVLNGDLGQGVLRKQESTPLMVTQMSAMMHLLTQAISYLSQQFKKVKVIANSDNHLRAQWKADKGRSTAQKYDSFATILHVGLKYALSKHPNVSFEIPVTPYCLFNIQGHRFFSTHSDTVISAGNVGQSISTGNIKNKINDLMSGLGRIDVCMIGHIHVSSHVMLNNGVELLSNGTMSGIDPFCQSIGIVKNIASQQLFEVTEDYAVGDLRSVKLLKADTMSELDEIIQPFKGKF
jgi:hypothetical protein